jgi:hypothetical protein
MPLVNLVGIRKKKKKKKKKGIKCSFFFSVWRIKVISVFILQAHKENILIMGLILVHRPYKGKKPKLTPYQERKKEGSGGKKKRKREGRYGESVF